MKFRERGLASRSAAPEGMPGGLALSAVLHLCVLLLVVLGMPSLFRPTVPEEMPIAVNLVTIGPHTRATHPNPEHPVRHAPITKAIAGPPARKPAPKPAPPKPTPPPTSAAQEAVPPPPKPPEAKPTPPKQIEAQAPPPLPELKPAPPKPKSAPVPAPEPKPAPAAPKEVARVQPPKPEQKPKPPRRFAKNEPKTRQKMYNPAAFESLLKNLAADQTAPSEDGRPQREDASGRASSQPQAPLGSELSASELALLREQIARCWDVPAGARDAKNLVVQIQVEVNPDGTVRQATILDQGRLASDPFFRAAAESARRALFNPLCTPLHLPPDKYAIWKNMVINFSPKDIL